MDTEYQLAGSSIREAAVMGLQLRIWKLAYRCYGIRRVGQGVSGGYCCCDKEGDGLGAVCNLDSCYGCTQPSHRQKHT